MKYYEAKFTFSPYSDDAADLLAALIADAGFESFNNDG
jgi:ribosomal protein L11 methyltransferase